MRLSIRPSILAALLVASALTWADEKPDVGPNLAAQSAADALRTFASTDGAFIAGGQLKETFNKDDLSTMLQYATDEVVVLSLTGEQIRQAFERSVSMYPSPNKSFLQISGFDVTFKKSPSPTRIVSVTANGAPLDNAKTYTVAMPANLARGAVGYFRVWEEKQITKTFAKTTMDDVLKGKRASEGTARYIAQ